MTAPTERWLIRGRVQGVGYRDWMVREARRRGIAGWVRNGDGGEVEALVHGPAEALAGLRDACLGGPPLASVEAIDVEAAAELPRSGFERRPSR